MVQAYEAMKQGEETMRQGKAIVVFTVMTIVFVSNDSLAIYHTKPFASLHVSP